MGNISYTAPVATYEPSSTIVVGEQYHWIMILSWQTVFAWQYLTRYLCSRRIMIISLKILTLACIRKRRVEILIIFSLMVMENLLHEFKTISALMAHTGGIIMQRAQSKDILTTYDLTLSYMFISTTSGHEFLCLKLLVRHHLVSRTWKSYLSQQVQSGYLSISNM